MDISLQPWAEGDLDLLVQANSPEMTQHLGGPESDAKLRARHQRYLALDGTGWMFRIVADGASAGSIGFWDQGWHGEQIFETGWGVLPAFQGRGIAGAAALLVIGKAREQRRHRSLHAFPSIHHPASNGICRKAGFTLLGEVDFEYPKGSLKRCNNWRFELLKEPG